MSISFAALKSLAIPEGVVTQIESNGVVLWVLNRTSAVLGVAIIGEMVLGVEGPAKPKLSAPFIWVEDDIRKLAAPVIRLEYDEPKLSAPVIRIEMDSLATPTIEIVEV